jgi:hypothetical protein
LVEGFGGGGVVCVEGSVCEAVLVEDVLVSVLAVVVSVEVVGPGGTGAMVALVCGSGAGVPLSSVPASWEQPTTTRVAAKAMAPKKFFIMIPFISQITGVSNRYFAAGFAP